MIGSDWARALATAMTLVLCACSQSKEGEGDKAMAGATAAADASCPDDGPRLPGTGLCAGRATNYLNVDSASFEAPEGCQWQVGEAEMPAGEYLLYHGLKCGERETKLSFSAGARRAVIELTGSAFGDSEALPTELISVYVAEGDPKAAVLMRAGEDQEDAVKGCVVLDAKDPGLPSDALLVDNPTEAATAKLEDGPRTACGTMGLDEDSMAFWRVFQGYAWYYNLGQDALEIDPSSLTVLRKDDAGNWEAAPG
ncbi:MAG: hypothetical protein ACKO1N_08400 [Erythrobacter sp.]